jgi:integrase/recombinase XerD
MPRSRFFGFGRVNLIKKVKVDGEWKFCPAVFDQGRKLNDLVRVRGQIETHSEGTYYLEWREQGQRRRQPVHNRALIYEQARLKGLELEAERKPPEIACPTESPLPFPVNTAAFGPAVVTHQFPPVTTLPNLEMPAVQLIWRGIESYLQELIANAVRSQLMNSGLITRAAIPIDGTTKASAIAQKGPPSNDAKPVVPPPPNSGTLIAEAIDSYLKDVEPPQREPKTYDEYRLVLYRFRDTCKKRYVEEVDRDDLLDFRRVLYSLGNEARTVFNRMGIVLQLLKIFGIEKLLKKGDKPKFVRNMREMYQTEDLNALFKACTTDEKVRYLFFLLTGERDKEVRYTAWPDIDFVRKCVRVTSKKQLGFKPKDKEEREIPVPSSLLTALRQYKARQSGPNPHNLVFPTAGGKADRKFENKLKKIAYRAGLNCGHCLSRHGNKCVEGPHCGNWFLHKFRHTYATKSLEDGTSIRTLQEWLGHSDLESTMVYLKYVRRKDIQQLVDNSELASLASHVSTDSEFRKTDVPGRKIRTDSGNVIEFNNHGHPQSV